MPCSRTQHGDACGVRTQDLKIRSPTLYHYATALPKNKNVKRSFYNRQKSEENAPGAPVLILF